MAPEQERAAGGPPDPSSHDREPVDELAASDADPRQCGRHGRDRKRIRERSTASGIEGQDEHRSTNSDNQELGTRESKKDASAREPRELHWRELVVMESRGGIGHRSQFFPAGTASAPCAGIGAVSYTHL